MNNLTCKHPQLWTISGQVFIWWGVNIPRCSYAQVLIWSGVYMLRCFYGHVIICSDIWGSVSEGQCLRVWIWGSVLRVHVGGSVFKGLYMRVWQAWSASYVSIGGILRVTGVIPSLGALKIISSWQVIINRRAPVSRTSLVSFICVCWRYDKSDKCYSIFGHFEGLLK